MNESLKKITDYVANEKRKWQWFLCKESEYGREDHAKELEAEKNRTMAQEPKNRQLKILKSEAKVLRYCGYSAKADYQLMNIVINGTGILGGHVNAISASEWSALQEMHKSCLIVPNVTD